VVEQDDPGSPTALALIERHLAFARANSPPEDVHALEVTDLQDRDVTFFGIRMGDELVGVGALKQLDEGHGEIKSMHTAEGARGRGVGRAMLDHLLAVARARGYGRVSLETGTMAAFAPARGAVQSGRVRRLRALRRVRREREQRLHDPRAREG
jgi:putative acetyltransferase